MNIPACRGFPLADALAAAVPGVPVALADDGHCMALGGYWRAPAGARSLLGMIVSTGVGGGVVLDGRVQTGGAGHIGHMAVDPRGPACPCGGRGCVEIYASGPSMVRWATGQGWVPAGGVADGARAEAGRRRRPRDGERVVLALRCSAVSTGAKIGCAGAVRVESVEPWSSKPVRESGPGPRQGSRLVASRCALNVKESSL